MPTDREPALLVVDDDAQTCRMLERYGRKVGYRVESRSGGREALAALATIRPDVALIDLQMPGTLKVRGSRISQKSARAAPEPRVARTDT
jgi:CheY-like chemotaxis protein